MKRDADEKELLDSVGRGEWKAAAGGKRERTRCSRCAKATCRKDPDGCWHEQFVPFP
jgi:hypothetical protein